MNIDAPSANTTVAEAFRSGVNTLSGRFGQREATWMMRIVFEHLMNYSYTDVVVRGDYPVSSFMQERIARTIDRLLADEPIQYIFSTAQFFGLKLKVTPAVLIPRPETEELVQMIVDRYGRRSDLHVLDACTGSGCIAVALARNLKFAHVDAIDISEEALEVARQNVEATHTDVTLFKADALRLDKATLPTGPYNIIVSNPPYIAEQEKAQMQANVLNYEPHLALFVNNSAPLVFYQQIAKYASTHLLAGGALYFEINPIYAQQLKQQLLAGEYGKWSEVEIINDMQGRQRFCVAYL